MSTFASFSHSCNVRFGRMLLKNSKIGIASKLLKLIPCLEIGEQCTFNRSLMSARDLRQSLRLTHVASNFYIAPCGQFFDDAFQELEFFNSIRAYSKSASPKTKFLRRYFGTSISEGSFGKQKAFENVGLANKH